jgi:hypothetical protein
MPRCLGFVKRHNRQCLKNVKGQEYCGDHRAAAGATAGATAGAAAGAAAGATAVGATTADTPTGAGTANPKHAAAESPTATKPTAATKTKPDAGGAAVANAEPTADTPTGAGTANPKHAAAESPTATKPTAAKSAAGDADTTTYLKHHAPPTRVATRASKQKIYAYAGAVARVSEPELHTHTLRNLRGSPFTEKRKIKIFDIQKGIDPILGRELTRANSQLDHMLEVQVSHMLLPSSVYMSCVSSVCFYGYLFLLS